MANARLVAVLVAILVLLLEVSTRAMARHHGKPDPWSSSEDDISMRARCTSTRSEATVVRHEAAPLQS
jgi:hypothetical protein